MMKTMPTEMEDGWMKITFAKVEVGILRIMKWKLDGLK